MPLMEAEGRTPMGGVRRALRLWGAHMKAGLVRELGFRGHFLVYVATEAMWLGLLLVFFDAIFRSSGNLAGWTRPQVLVLVGTYHALTQAFEALFFGNLAQLGDMIRSGRLDGVLARPASTLFLISIQKVEWGGILQALIGILIAAWASHGAGVALSPALVFFYLFFLVSGLMILYSFMLAISSVAFWTIRTDDFLTLWYEVTEFARYPAGIYGPVVKAILTFGVPLLVVTNVPARVLAFGELNAASFVSPCAALVLLAASTWLFRRGVKRYHSASS